MLGDDDEPEELPRGLTGHDLAATLRVLAAIQSDPGLLQGKPAKQLRTALLTVSPFLPQPAGSQQKRSREDKQAKQAHHVPQREHLERKAQAAAVLAKKMEDKEKVNTRSLRAHRLKTLEQLQEQETVVAAEVAAAAGDGSAYQRPAITAGGEQQVEHGESEPGGLIKSEGEGSSSPHPHPSNDDGRRRPRGGVPIVADGPLFTTGPANPSTPAGGQTEPSGGEEGAGGDQHTVVEEKDSRRGDERESTSLNSTLNNNRSCYSCKHPFTVLHHFYDSLCPECAALNFSKRHQTADMSGKVCLVTGARVKIGFHITLKLLRAGATVIATSRFPVDMLDRFRAEKDSESWMPTAQSAAAAAAAATTEEGATTGTAGSLRLHGFGLDLRDIGNLDRFVAFLGDRFGRLDVIVNNACQTVRRPPSFYKHLLEREMVGLASITGSGGEAGGAAPTAARSTNSDGSGAAHAHGSSLDGYLSFMQCGSGNGVGAHPPMLQSAPSTAVETDNKEGGSCPRVNPSAVSLSTFPSAPLPAFLTSIPSAALSQMPMMPSDVCDGSSESAKQFPENVFDVNNQQVDLRRHNSWRMRLHEVPTPELAEVFAINAMAPFLLNSRLKALMMIRMSSSSGDDACCSKFIINVSAMEGKFNRYKAPHHPHTNMAKAALNMMTRTSAADYSKDSIFMNAVDTGWINEEAPAEVAAAIAAKHNFQTPIDEIDAAARVLDPVFVGVSMDHNPADTNTPPYGLFYKDYRPTDW